jgi:hypothetical protein
MLGLIISLFSFVIFYVVPRGQSTQLTRGHPDGGWSSSQHS